MGENIMKPWEMNWDNTNETKTEDIKPWEKKWDTGNSTDFNVKNYNGTSLIGEAGEDAKPYSKMDLFLKNLFTFDVKTGAEVEERQANNPRIQALEKVRADGFDDVKWGEVGKSLVRGSLELGKSATASPLKIYGDWSMDERDTSLMTPQELKDVKYNNFKAQAYIKTGEYIEKLWDMGLKAEWLKEDEETFKGSFVENPSMTRVLSLGASAIPSIAFFGGTAKITGSRKAASILLAGADNDDLYFEAREAGESQNKALGLYATGTAGTAILEKYGFDQIFNQRVTAPLSKRIMSATLSEGFTEGFQTAYQNAVKKYGYDDTQDLFEGVIESVIAGALSGGAISTADAGYVKLQNARGKLKDKGATDEALDMMQEELARELSYHRDTIEPMFQSKITESLNNLEKFVKDNEGTAEAQKALKTKAELEEVYNLVNKSLVDNGVNAEVANADAKVWQGIALWGSQETGLSPMEYINQRMPKVQKKRLADFLNERERRIATGNESELEILRQDINRLKKGVSRKASKGLRLSQFIKQQGGINDDRGDIKSMGASVGLLNKNGISLDEATFKAWEAGYIQSTERPEINQLLDLLSDDLGNHPVYSFEDKTTEDNRQYYLALEQALYEAGADINKDSLEVINEKLKAYEKTLPKEEVIELDDFIPFQGGETKLNMSSALPQNIANKEVNVVRVDDSNIVDERTLRAKIQNLINNRASQETSDGALLSFINNVWVENKGKQRVAKHIAHSSLSGQQNSRSAAVDDILSLLRESAFVEASEENKGKNDYDKVLRFYVPIQINNGDIYPVRIVALHKKGEQSVKLTGDVYDVILEDKGVIKNQATHTNSAKNKSTSALEGQPDKISIANLLKNIKGVDKTLYRESYNPRKDIPSVRGGWTKDTFFFQFIKIPFYTIRC